MLYPQFPITKFTPVLIKNLYPISKGSFELNGSWAMKKFFISPHPSQRKSIKLQLTKQDSIYKIHALRLLDAYKWNKR